MKRLVLILTVMFAVLSMSAQTVINQKFSKVYDSGSDTIVAATSNVIFIKDVTAPYYYYYSVDIDDHSGGNTATLAISGSLDGSNYKSLVSDSYAGTGSDTTFIGGVTTATGYPYIKITVTPSDTMLLKDIRFNV